MTLGVMPDYADEAKEGMKITGVREGGPRPGRSQGRRHDIRIGGKPISTIYDYMESMKGYKPGDKVEVEVKRDGSEVKFQVDLGASTAPPGTERRTLNRLMDLMVLRNNLSRPPPCSVVLCLAGLPPGVIGYGVQRTRLHSGEHLESISGGSDTDVLRIATTWPGPTAST